MLKLKGRGEGRGGEQSCFFNSNNENRLIRPNLKKKKKSEYGKTACVKKGLYIYLYIVQQASVTVEGGGLWWEKQKTVKANVNSTVIETTACIQIRRAKSRETATVCVFDTHTQKKRVTKGNTEKKGGRWRSFDLKKKAKERQHNALLFFFAPRLKNRTLWDGRKSTSCEFRQKKALRNRANKKKADLTSTA